MMVNLSRQLTSYLSWFGLVGMVQSQLTKWAIGMYFTHPAIFVGSLLSALFIKVSTDKLEEGAIISEIDKMTEYFAVVTSNLRNRYLFASRLATQSFLVALTNKVNEPSITEQLHQAIVDLVEGHGKDNSGSMQRFFDERDTLTGKLQTEEIEGLHDWLNIVIHSDD